MRSSLATQILADVCGLPVHLVAEREQTAIGAAIWAGVGVGLFPDYPSAIQNMVRFSQVVEPNPQYRREYDFYFDKYCRTYDQLKDLMHEVVAHESQSEEKLKLAP